MLVVAAAMQLQRRVQLVHLVVTHHLLRGIQQRQPVLRQEMPVVLAAAKTQRRLHHHLQQQHATTAAATLTIPQGASVQGNDYYDPAALTVKVGDTIAVENKDTTPHTVTNGKDATDPNMGKLFDTSIINAGDSADVVTADLKPGDYPYFCAVHPYMTGSLTVQ